MLHPKEMEKYEQIIALKTTSKGGISSPIWSPGDDCIGPDQTSEFSLLEMDWRVLEKKIFVQSYCLVDNVENLSYEGNGILLLFDQQNSTNGIMFIRS